MAASTVRQTSREKTPRPAPPRTASGTLAGHPLLRLAKEERAHLSGEVERAAAEHDAGLAARGGKRPEDRLVHCPGMKARKLLRRHRPGRVGRAVMHAGRQRRELSQ